MTVRKSLARAIALAVTAASLLTIAGPVSAGGDTRATVFVVHGLPGGKVDVCIGGLGEVASGLPYAERFKKRLDPGSYKIKVRAASNGECKGDVVAKSPLTVAELDNLTAVVRSVDGTPGITTFGNDVSPTAPGEIRLTTAHMMKGGPIDVWSTVWSRSRACFVVTTRPPRSRPTPSTPCGARRRASLPRSLDRA